MARRLAAGIAAGCLLAGPAVTAQLDDVLEELAEIEVIGEQPGPALWQVKSADHTLWILGEVSPLPAKVTWRSKQVERILAGAQQVILPDDGTGRPAASPAAAKRSAAAVESPRLPDGKTLKDVLAPETYARFEAARRRFAKRDKDMELLTPGHANNRLLSSAFKVLKLAPRVNPVSDTVSRLAQKAGVRVVHVEVDAPGQEAPPPRQDLPPACLPPEPLLAQLDDGGLGWRALANAWSIGDINALRILVPGHAIHGLKAEKCALQSDGNERRYAEALARRQTAWLGASERALESNQSSLAVVQMAELFASDGLIASLRARGYEVVEP
jgi:hypothetical protein